MGYFFIDNLFGIIAFIVSLILFFLAIQAFTNRFVGETNIFSQAILSGEVISRRKKALDKAKSFLKPYDNPMGTLTLSNKNCTITYEIVDSQAKIVCVSKKADKQNKIHFFKAIGFIEDAKTGTNDDSNDFWNAICSNFSYSSDYYTLLDICNKKFFRFDKDFYEGDKKQPIQKKVLNQKIIDINTATEAEITALPGISIVLAKKIIKYRDEVAPFKDFNDFIRVANVKKHFEDQLIDLVCVKPVKIKKIVRNQERIVDI